MPTRLERRLLAELRRRLSVQPLMAEADVDATSFRSRARLTALPA